MPPATITTSRPRPSSTGHAFPYGPRTPRTAPGAAAQIASVTAPTARTVWTSRGPSVRDTETGTSPPPKAESIVTCPGATSSGGPPSGSSSSVHVSCVSRRRRTTRKGRGVIGASSLSGSATAAITVDVEQPEAGPLQPLHEDLREARHQGVAEGRVGLALAADAGAVKRGRAHRPERPPVEVPAERREEPRPADDLAGLDRLDRGRRAGRDEHLDGDDTVAHEVEVVCLLSLAKEDLVLVEVDVRPAAGDQRHVLGRERREERDIAQELLNRRHRIPPWCGVRSAAR